MFRIGIGLVLFAMCAVGVGRSSFGGAEEVASSPSRELLTVQEEAGRKLLTKDNATEGSSLLDEVLTGKDAFTKEQLKNGFVGLYIFGILYMFIALALVCDEFFVPALEIICEKAEIPNEIAGATLMAAGGTSVLNECCLHDVVLMLLS